MLAFLLTQLIGLLRVVVVYRAFGASAGMDSFNAANRVAELLFNLVAGGALGSAFIPTFTGLLARKDQDTAWKLASAVANLLFLVLTLLAVLSMIFAPQIVRHGLYVLSPGESPGQEALTAALLRWLLPTVVIFGLSGLVMGILNAHQRFWLPAIAPAMYSLGQILGVLLLPSGWGIYRLAAGALAGALFHLLVQLPDLLRLRGRYWLMLGLRMAEVREVARLMGPRVLGVAVMTSQFDAALVDELSGNDTPLVRLDAGQVRRGRSNIRINYAHGARQAVLHLQKLGHRRLALIAGPPDRVSAATYRDAIVEAIAAAGLPAPLVVGGDNRVEGGAAGARQLLAAGDRPSAILCGNDLAAVGALQAIEELGLRAPAGVSVIGSDDIAMARYTNPPLTTIRIPRDVLGRRAFEALLKMHKSKARRGTESELETELVIRRSTGPPPGMESRG